MSTLTPQQKIDLAAEQLRLILVPFARNQHELDSMIDWAKHNTKAYKAWYEGKPAELLLELYQADQSKKIRQFHKLQTKFYFYAMLYHYTNMFAMKSILRDAKNKG